MKNPACVFVLVWLGGLVIAGCAPYPHRVVRVPEIRGTLADTGVPIPDAIVLVAQKRDDPCGNASNQGKTNARGEFLVSEKSETKLFYSFLNPPDTVGQLTSLCFQIAGGPNIFKGRVMHRTAESVVVNVKCDRGSPTCELVRCEGNCRGVSMQP
jgi:hypothetical protein